MLEQLTKLIHRIDGLNPLNVILQDWVGDLVIIQEVVLHTEEPALDASFTEIVLLELLHIFDSLPGVVKYIDVVFIEDIEPAHNHEQKEHEEGENRIVDVQNRCDILHKLSGHGNGVQILDPV